MEHQEHAERRRGRLTGRTSGTLENGGMRGQPRRRITKLGDQCDHWNTRTPRILRLASDEVTPPTSLLTDFEHAEHQEYS